MANQLRKNQKRILFGAGGHAKVIFDLAELIGEPFDHVVVDKMSGSEFLGQNVEQLGSLEDRIGEDFRFVVGIGDNRIRREKFSDLMNRGGAPFSAVHPTAVISKYAEIDSGAVVFANSVVNAGARVGKNSIVNTSAVVDHDSTIGDHAQICPGVIMSGIVQIKEGAFIGSGTSIANGISIGKWSYVGAGSVVVSDLPDRVLAYGCPARVIRSLD